jgi:ATP-binding cassette subfamily B (MDR/TAP) protein 1
MCILQFIILAKGKFAIVALLFLVDDPHSNTTAPSTSARYNFFRIHPFLPMFLLCPLAQMPLHLSAKSSLKSTAQANSPSPPSPSPIPPGPPSPSSQTSPYELTFIVGSGKSTIAQLLLGMYQPQEGTVLLDDTELCYLDPSWVRGNMCRAGQGTWDVVLDWKSILENVKLGVEGATEEMVEEVCRTAVFHEFVRDLSEAILGGGGAAGVALSGGQKQRLAIARVRLRNPNVLVLVWFFIFISRFIYSYFHFVSDRRSYICPRPHLSHPGIRSPQALAQEQDDNRHHS